MPITAMRSSSSSSLHIQEEEEEEFHLRAEHGLQYNLHMSIDTLDLVTQVQIGSG
jgi:hypothetical protein